MEPPQSACFVVCYIFGLISSFLIICRRPNFPGGVFTLPEREDPQNYAGTLMPAPVYVGPQTVLHFWPDIILCVAHLLTQAFTGGAFTRPEKEATLNPARNQKPAQLHVIFAVLHFWPEFIHSVARLRTVVFSWRGVYKPSKGGAPEIYRNSDASPSVCQSSV